MNNKIAIFAGTFDPYTIGHHDLVMRSLPLFDEVIIGIGNNSSKIRTFSLDYVLERIEKLYAYEPKVKVKSYSGLTTKFAEMKNAKFLIRGIRNTIDFEYENTIAQANKYLNPNIETVFLITDPKYAHVSSTVVRELHKNNVDIKPFLPY